MKPMADKALGTLVNKAVKSSVAHHEILVQAGINAVAFASKHGRCDYMNALFEGVNNQDGLAFKTFIRRLHEKIGADAFSWSKKNGFTIAATNADNDSKVARDQINAMTEKALSDIPWVSDDQKDQVPVSLDAYLKSVIKRIESQHAENSFAPAIVADLTKFADKVAKANERKANVANDTADADVAEAA